MEIRRLQKHKASYKCYLNPNIKQGKMMSFDILQNNDYNIILIEEYPCNNKLELLERENHFITNMKCINYNKPIHDKKAIRKRWEQNNKDYYLKRIEYVKNNRDKANIRNKNYRYSCSVGHLNKIDTTLFS